MSADLNVTAVVGKCSQVAGEWSGNTISGPFRESG